MGETMRNAYVRTILRMSLFVVSSVVLYEANATKQYATDELSVSHEYAYRQIARSLAMRPNSRVSDNVKPLSWREIRLLNHNSRLLQGDAGKSYQPVREINLDSAGSTKPHPFIYENYGARFDGRQNTALSVSGNFYPGNYFMASHQIRVESNDEFSEPSLYRFRLKTGLGRFTLSYAKESLVLGPGYFGNLLHSKNVEPENISLIKIEDPYKLPYLGYFRLYWWWIAYDDRDRVNKDPNLLGLRLSLKPVKYAEMNFTRTSYYGGTNNDTVRSVSDLLKIATAEDENAATTSINTDQLAAIDISFYIPVVARYTPFNGAKLYTERVWNDLKAFWQTDDRNEGTIFRLLGTSMLNGIFLTTGRLDFYLEFVKTTEAIYAHGSFGRDGATDNGYVIGHYIGRDARAYLSELYYELNHRLHVFGRLGFIERGLNLDKRQLSEQVGAGINYFFLGQLQLGISANYIHSNRTDIDESAVNYNFIEADYRELQGFVSLSYYLD